MFGALIVAAGKGKRMDSDTPKQFMMLNNKHVVVHTAETFFMMQDFFKKIVLVIPPGSMDLCRDIFSDIYFGDEDFFTMVEGGKERQDSVLKGLLKLIGDDIKVVSIHDGARPMVSASLIRETANKALKEGAVIPVVELKDTIKEVNGEGEVVKTVLRDRYRLVQTPQCFRKEIIMDSFKKAGEEGFYGTDDASLVERAGYKVSTFPGEASNIKLTTPEDFAFAEMILERGEANL